MSDVVEKNLKEKIKEKWDNAVAWTNEPNNKKYLRITAFSLISALWAFLISGMLSLTLLYLAVGAATLFVKDALSNKKKFVYNLAFWGITALTFFLAMMLSSSGYTAFFTIGVWIIAYMSLVRTPRLTEWVAGNLIPFAVVMYTEVLQGTTRMIVMTLIKFPDVRRFGYVISVMLVLMITAFFTCLFNSKRIGNYISIGIFALLGNINFFVITLTRQPFTLSDLVIAKTAAGVLNNQKLEIGDWLKFLMGLALLAALYAIVTVAYKNKNKKKKFIHRTVPLGLFCLFFAVAFAASNWLYSTVLLYGGHLKYGFIGNFYITLNERVTIPEYAKDYVIDDKNDEGDNNPNVIIIMNEAFSDLGTTFDLTFSEDPLKYFHTLQEEYPNGITYSSVRGNNTCSSEWEFLSGSPTALTTKGAIIYQNNCKPMNTLVSLFNSRGYTTVGMHPYFGFGYNRDAFYKALDFDQTVFIEDMPEGLNKVRGYITDEENYKHLISLYEQNEQEGDSPFFCFNITMQNHGSYTTNPMNDVTMEGEEPYSEVNTYLSVLKQSDEALKGLLSYFESVEEDTIILMFGDHQPLIDTSFYDKIYNKPFTELTVEELVDVYAVPYLIWANYDLNEEAAPAETSNCYLSTILFEVGNIPKSTWLNMTDKYREEYPVVSAIFVKEADGDIKTKETIFVDSPEDNLLREYQKYSYGILYGTGQQNK